MPDQALFAYRVQLPDGSETVRTGGADTAPTYGQLADYAANQGEKFLGHVDMSPAPRPTAPPPPPQPVVPAAEPSPAPAAAPAPPPAPSLATRAGQTLFPDRSFVSQTPSMVAGTLGGIGGTALGAMTGPAAPVAIPILATAGSALGSGAMEYLQAKAEQAPGATSPPSEEGTPFERAERAAVRGGFGEAVTQPVRWVAKGVQQVAGPLFKAAEDVAPALAQNLPATVKAVPGAEEGTFRSVGHLLNDPAQLAAAELSPEGQQTLFRAWWQRNAPKGAGNVVNAWDQLAQTPGAQEALTAGQHKSVSTLVDSLRPAVAPLQNLSFGQLTRGSVPGLLVAHAGHPWLAPVVSAASEYAVRSAPKAFLSPTAGPLLASLPAVGRAVASPADFLLRASGQYLGDKAFP